MVTRKAIEELKRAYGLDLGGCPRCWGVYIAGMPGLFAVAYREGSAKLTHDEAREYYDGCPGCGEPVKTYPIVMRGLPPEEDRSGPRVVRKQGVVPDPYPINQWPEPQGPPGKRGNVYDTDEEEAGWAS